MVLSVMATIGMLLLGGCVKLLTGGWLHPATVFCLFWSGMCGLAIASAPENITSPSGALWIAFNAVFVAGGGILGSALATSRDDAARGRTAIWPDTVLRKHLTVCMVLGLLFAPFCLRSQGIGLGQLSSLGGILKVAMKMSLMRYSNTEQAIPSYVEVLLAASYMAPLLGGTLFAQWPRRPADTRLSLLSLVPCIAAFAVQSTKASVLFGATMWVSGYLATRPYGGTRTVQLRLRTVGMVALAVPVVLLFLVAADALRGGKGNLPGSGSLLTGRVKTQLAGHLPALSQWMDTHDLEEIEPQFGRYTVAGLYRYVLPTARVNGVYSESVYIPTGVTNVYTYFRQMIEDCTRPGALLAMLVLSVLGGFAYRRVVAGRAGWVGLLATCYAGTIFALGSIFNYNSIVLALLAYCLWWVARAHRLATAGRLRLPALRLPAHPQPFDA